MSELPVPIHFDPQTGQWTSDGHPMILIPRRFFVFIQMESERRFGIEQTCAMYEAATRLAAKVWCRNTMEHYGLDGTQVFRLYLERVSKRGMGLFSLQHLDEQAGTARIDLRNSIMAAEYGPGANRCVCYSFASAFAGAMEVIHEQAGRVYASVEAHEDCCASNGADQCSFVVHTSGVG